MMLRTAVLAFAAVGMTVGAVAAEAAWYTSKFGKDDQAGKSNLMTPERVKTAMTYIKQSKTISLAREYLDKMPLFGHRVFATCGTNGLSGGPLGDNNVIWMDDTLTAEIGQVGTQFDGLGHVGINDKFYDGLAAKDVFRPTRMKKLGIEHVKPFFTKGVLIDMVACKAHRSMVVTRFPFRTWKAR